MQKNGQNGQPLRVSVKAPAKLNLGLDVTGLLPNGYHTVDMVMQTVSLWERVEITRSKGYSLRLPGSPVPVNDKNTATKAAAAFFYETGLLAGADIVVHKRVPTRAGLAGGSADAAAVLVGLNALYGARLTTAELCNIGAQVGADVPFAITGGTARVGGIGEVLQPISPVLCGCWFCIAMPRGGGVSTPAAYAAFDALQGPAHPDIDAVQAAIEAGDVPALCAAMGNALQAASGNEVTAKLCAAFLQNGALGSMMTGSGAAVFGVFATKKQAEAAAKAMRRMAKQLFVVRPVPHGPVVDIQ